ncbi:response regulator [Cohnella soli]|uniref:Response regulator n=1 Tax=Cohnella soli TaxID=425005 RepID=A0ABW0HY05_9BACL
MYKVMIVDDEYYVRMDLRMMIDWAGHGFQLTEDAVDGQDALDKIHQCRPDIVLLDIGMPGMNGITLLSRLKESQFQGQIVILSCHDDFNYVKDALLLGAQDYLLKHTLEPDILEKTLEDVVGKLEGNRQRNEQVIKWKHLEAQSLQMERNQFFGQLLHGYAAANRNSIAERLNRLELRFSLTHSVVMIVKIHEEPSAQNRGQSSEPVRAQVAEEINRTYLNADAGYCYAAEDGELVLILGFESVPSFLYLQNSLHEQSNGILALIRERFGLGASIGISGHCSSTEHIADYYLQAKAAIAGVYFIGKNRIIPYSEVSDYSRKPSKSFKEYEELLLRERRDPLEIAGVVEEICNGIIEQKVSLEEAKAFYFEFVSFIKKQQRDYGISEQELFETGRSPYEALNGMETAEEAKIYLTKVMLRLSELLPIGSSGKYRPEIAQAIAYMKNHYAGDLSLEVVASTVNMNSTYFSNLFKKETGQNFVAFLQRIRLEKAKALLRTTHDKVYDIASQVGIDNYHYFCKAFKQFSGMTPIQYRTKEKQ